MKIVTEPRVYLVTSQELHCYGGYEQFLTDEGIEGREVDHHNQDIIPEIAGRLCYMSFNNPRPGGNEKYLERIIDQRHGSVLEHSVLGFILADISRSCSHELVRHRMFSFSQLSQRYCEEVAFVRPPKYKDPSFRLDEWKTAMDEALCHYSNLCMGGDKATTSDKKAIREAARSVLPNCTATKLMMTGNVRAWRNFIELRTSTGAEAEMRKVALKIYEKLKEVAPNCFQDYLLNQDTQEVLTKNVKV